MADNNPDSQTRYTPSYSGPGFEWILLGLAVFALDFFTRFKGIDFSYFRSIALTDWRIYINGLTLLLVALYYLFINKEERNPKDMLSFAALVMFLSIIISMGGIGYLGATIHLVFAFSFLFAGLYKIMEKSQANMIILGALFLDFFAFSLFSINKLIFPIWFLLPLFFTKPSRKRSWLILFIVLFYAFHSVGSIVMFGGTQQMLNGKDITDFKDFASTSWKNTKEFGESLWTSTVTGYKRQKNITQAMVFGDYYTSQVDQNVRQPLGVSITEVKSTDPEVYEDEPLIVYSRLTIRTLKEEITIKNFCHAESVLPDSIKPDTEKVSQYDEITVDCMFDRCRFSPGSKTIYFNHAFGFQTLSYLRNYFIDRERMQSMIRQDPNINTPEDILRNIGVYDSNPIALSTNGPIKIGVELEKSQPIAIDRKRDIESFRLGITLENVWEGNIKDVKNLTIILPKEMHLELDGKAEGSYCGGYNFEAKTCAAVFGEENEWCDDDASNIYVLNQTGKNQRIIPAGQPGISLYKSLICRIGIDKSDYDKFLGNAPISIKNFKLIADYEYELQRSLTVNIKKTEYGGGCEKIQEDIGIEETECKDYSPDKNNLPPDDHIERYKNYQSTVRNIVKVNKPQGLDYLKAEALIAAIMSEASGIGNIDKNDNKIPDYLTGYGIRYPATFLDNPIKEIEMAAKFLKTKINSEKDIKLALDSYKTETKIDTFSTDNALKYYTLWKNRLCKGEADAAIEEEEAVPIATLFKKNDLVGEDKNNDGKWTDADQYYFIKGFKKNIDGIWVYLLSDSKNTLLDQMKIETFNYYRNLHSGSYKVMIQRPAQEPAAWEGLLFNPNIELKNGVVS